MTTETNTAAAEHAANRAVGAPAKAEDLNALAELAATADCGQQADHIRGIVATTMAHLVTDATLVTRDSAAPWAKWALGLSDALPAAPVNP